MYFYFLYIINILFKFSQITLVASSDFKNMLFILLLDFKKIELLYLFSKNSENLKIHNLNFKYFFLQILQIKIFPSNLLIYNIILLTLNIIYRQYFYIYYFIIYIYITL